MITSMRRRVAVALAALAITAAGCGLSGTEYAVGDCLKTSVNQEGQAQKTECTDPDSFEVKMLAKNGGRPNCPYYMGKGNAMGGAAYVSDTTTGITYCGNYNGAY